MSELVARIMAEAGETGLFGAVRVIAEQPIEDVVDVYSEAMRAAYWDRKDVTLAGGLAIGGASRLLAAAGSANLEVAFRYRSAAKTLAYDYASFTWPGWDEKGITISHNEAAAGRAAAHMNLTLAIELGKGSLPRSRAHWMLGAHYLTAGDYDEASRQFNSAEIRAVEAEALTDVALNRAYLELTAFASGVDGATERFDAACGALAEVEYGPDLVDQVTTVQRVIGLS